MKKLAYIIIGWLAVETHGAQIGRAVEWRPSPALLQAVQQIESSGGLKTYGDQGRSLGAFQMSEPAWIDVSAYRKARSLKVYDYREFVMHPYINRAYASDYLKMIHEELSRKLRRAPSAGELYAAYNMGLANFAECDYRLANVNPVTAEKCRQIHLMIARAQAG